MSEEWNENGRIDGIDAPAMVSSGEASFRMNENAEGGAEKMPSKHDPKALEAP